jgi:hypothetical protein
MCRGGLITLYLRFKPPYPGQVWLCVDQMTWTILAPHVQKL